MLGYLIINMDIVPSFCDEEESFFAVYYILFGQLIPAAAFRMIFSDQGVCCLGSTCCFVITRYIKAIGDFPGGHTHFS